MNELKNCERIEERKYNLKCFLNEIANFLYTLRLANELQFVRKKQNAKKLYKQQKRYIHKAAEEVGKNNDKISKCMSKPTEKRVYRYWLHSLKTEDRLAYMRLNIEV